jgi:hypothetical protein
MDITKIYLLYSYENIDKYKHPDIIPLKLVQSEYFESEAFRMLHVEDLPECQNIGFVTFKGLEKITTDISFNIFMDTTKKNIKEITPFINIPISLNQAIISHGENFRVLWDYLSDRLYTKQKYSYNNFTAYIRNCWIAPFNIVAGFLRFAKKAFQILSDAPPPIKKILYSDSKYKGDLLGKGCLKKFGVPYYPFHAFIFERLIWLYKFILQNPKKTLCVMACHADSPLKFNTIMNNINFIKPIVNDIILVNSSNLNTNGFFSKLKMTGLDFSTCENDDRLCYSKYIHVYDKFNFGEYRNIILCNDSFIIVKSLKKFQKAFLKDNEMTSLTSSNEIKYHYTDYLRCYNSTAIHTIIDYYKKLNETVYKPDYSELVKKYELDSTSLFSKKTTIYNAEKNYYGNINFDKNKISIYLNNKDFPIIKIKALHFLLSESPSSEALETITSILKNINFDINNSDYYSSILISEIPNKTTLYLLYSYEDISEIVHRNIIPLKVDQTFYFESEAFRMLKEKDLPKSDNIGFITPKGLQLAMAGRSLVEFMDSLDKKFTEITPLIDVGFTLEQAVISHGNNFRLLCDFLSEKLYGKKYDYSGLETFTRNCWVAPYATVVKYLQFAKKSFNIIKDAPESIQSLLVSDSRYGDAAGKKQCLKKFGFPHYPFHPFIFERLICLYKYILNNPIEKAYNTILYLVYTNESIDLYKHQALIPLKITETEYLSAEAFTLLKAENIHKCENIGFITVDVLNNMIEKKGSLDEFIISIDNKIDTVTPFIETGQNIINKDKNISIIWDYISNELGYKSTAYPLKDIKRFDSVCWVAPYNVVVKYLHFFYSARQIISTCPAHVKTLINDGNNYSIMCECLIGFFKHRQPNIETKIQAKVHTKVQNLNKYKGAYNITLIKYIGKRI